MNVTLAHFIWIGDNQLPALYQKCLESFYRIHPNWTVKLWFNKDIEKVIEESKYDFNKHTSFINRYNFIKYHILAKEGGWFVDLDIEWKLPIDQIYTDKITDREFPDLIVPVRSWPLQQLVDIRANDDMLIYAKKGLFNSLLKFIEKREDIDFSRKYEPFGPISLSKWLHSIENSRIYLYESEIQKNGYYCNHINGESWRFF